ncbi:Proteasome Activator Complex Subunit 4 [Manis pentadactyla]|nr:Proteasome Activator Complex Subunit 4 [Manis pentadactyla]
MLTPLERDGICVLEAPVSIPAWVIEMLFQFMLLGYAFSSPLPQQLLVDLLLGLRLGEKDVDVEEMSESEENIME